MRFLTRLWLILILLVGFTTSLSTAVEAAPRGSPVARFSWPITPHQVLRRFEPPATPYGPGHRGVDLAGQLSQPVFAAGSGTVRYAGTLVDRGVVSIEHLGNLHTSYEPVVPAVVVGQQVRRGQLIGRLAAGHGDNATCLHWGVRRGEVYFDPLRFFAPLRIRLLPWREPGAQA